MHGTFHKYMVLTVVEPVLPYVSVLNII